MDPSLLTTPLLGATGLSPSLLPTLLLIAVLLPLASFFLILLFANSMGKSSAMLATGALAGCGNSETPVQNTPPPSKEQLGTGQQFGSR